MERTAPRPPRRSPATRRRRRVLATVLVVLLLLAATAAATGWYLLYRPDREVAAGQLVEVEIASGSSTAQIGHTLSDAGVIPNALMFRLKARYSATDGHLKAGAYELTTGMDYDEVLAKLAKGPDIVYYDVTIPEGFTVKQIAARFAEKTGVSQDEMLALVTTGAPQFASEYPFLSRTYKGTLEGYLFPATYRIKEGTSAEEIVRMMLDAFKERTADLDMTYAESKNLDLHDIVTIASIIEREVKLADEYPLVSSVIYNRLRIHMRLQLDSTVFYGLPEGTKVLTKADLQNGDPYNTYSHDGLPVGPLGNPGMQALEAAAHPAETDYLYYVLTGEDGSQTFATNYEDFLKAVQIYRDKFVNK